MAAKKTKPETVAFNLPKYYPIWVGIFLATFFTFSGLLTEWVSGCYIYDAPKAAITLCLFFIFVVALGFGLKKNDTKLLYFTGLLEFIALLLPLLTFSATPWYLPYSLTSVFIFSFPLLWVLIPAGLLYVSSSDKAKSTLVKALTAVTLLIGVVWPLSGSFDSYTYDWNTGRVASTVINWSSFLFFFSLMIVPLAIWFAEYRKLVPHKYIGKSGGVMGVLDRNFPEFLMLLVILLLIVIGFAMNHPYYTQYNEYCGDWMCSPDEEGWCYTDCGWCGDGFCNNVYPYYEDSESCPMDCGEPSKTIRVQVTGGDNCATIKVVLKDGTSKTVLDTKEGNNWFPTFQSIEAESVYVQVSSHESTKSPVMSRPIMSAEEDTIRITLDADYCSAPVIIQKGTLRVKVLDKNSGAQVGADVQLYDLNNTLISRQYVFGIYYFALDPGYYYLVATAGGYTVYYGTSDTVLVEGGKESTKTIQLEPL